jgi:hypothetical protein
MEFDEVAEEQELMRRIKAFEARTPHGIPPEPLMAFLSPLEDRDNEFRVRLMDDEENLEAALALRIGDFQEPSPSDWGLTENAISFLSDLVNEIDFEGDMPQSTEEWYRWWYENTFFEYTGDRNEKVFMDFDLPSFNEPTPSDLEIIEQAANAYVELRSNDPESLESFSEEEIDLLQDAVLITRKLKNVFEPFYGENQVLISNMKLLLHRRNIGQ